MKNPVSLFCTFLLIFTMAACGSQNSATNSDSPEPSSQTADTQQSSPPDSTQQPLEDENNGETAENANILVAYFSATGNTKKIAEYMADAMGADLYEIVPAEPYTAEDLNYSDNNSRTSVEMNDDSARPAISGNVEQMAQYDTVFLGYPIWWGQAPRILCTFIESYDFSGKTIVPFCTSGSSGIGSSAQNLHGLAASNATWLDGERLRSGSTREDVVNWINSLGLDIAVQ